MPTDWLDLHAGAVQAGAAILQFLSAAVLIGVTIWYARSAKRQANQAEAQTNALVDQTKKLQEEINEAHQQVEATRDQMTQQRNQFLEERGAALQPILTLSGEKIHHSSRLFGPVNQRISMDDVVMAHNIGPGPALNFRWRIAVDSLSSLLVDPQQIPYLVIPPGGTQPLTHQRQTEDVFGPTNTAQVELFAQDIEGRRYEYRWRGTKDGWYYEETRRIDANQDQTQPVGPTGTK